MMVIFENEHWRIAETDKVDVFQKKNHYSTTATFYGNGRYGVDHPERLPKYIHKELAKYAETVETPPKRGKNGKLKKRVKGGMHPWEINKQSPRGLKTVEGGLGWVKK